MLQCNYWYHIYWW